MRTTSSSYCLIKGRTSSLAALTTRPAKRTFNPARPALPPAPKGRDKVKRTSERKRLRQQIRKLFPAGTWPKWGANSHIAAELDVPYNDVLCLMADRPLGTPALERIAAAILKRHAKETT